MVLGTTLENEKAKATAVYDTWDDEGGYTFENGFKPKTIHVSDLDNDKIKSDGWSTDYYQLPTDAKEMQDLIEYKEMNFAIGNIFKACYRLGNKKGNGLAYDLNKIIWYAQRELDRLSDES